MENINMYGSLQKISLRYADYNTVLLDFDGTIVPSEKVFLNCWQKVFKNNYHCEFTEYEYIKYELQQDTRLIDYLITNHRICTDTDVDKRDFMSCVYDNYTVEFKNMLNDYDFTKVLDHISQWNESGIALGIVSTSKRKYLEMFFEKYKAYRQLFSCILCREDVTKLKPDPIVYLTAVDELKTTAAKCLVIEDSLKGIKGAVAAEMAVIRVLENTFNVDITISEHNIPTVYSIEDIYFE